MIRSLRARLLLGMVLGIVGLLIAFSFTIYLLVSHSLQSSFDASLAMAAKAIAGQVEQDAKGARINLEGLSLPAFVRRLHPFYFQIWRQDGSTLTRSASLGGADLPPIRGKLDILVHAVITLPNGVGARGIGLTFLPRTEADESPPAHAMTVSLVLAHDSSHIQAQLRVLRYLLLGGSSATVLFAVFVAITVVSRGLRPLHAVARQIADISIDHLQARVACRDLPAEIVPVVEKLNHLLDRLESAFERERCFTADAAHELRTPLAGLRSTIEVVAMRSRNPSQYQQALCQCLSISTAMQATVDTLLMLARLEAGQINIRPEPVCLAKLMDCGWQRFAPAASARSIVWRNDLPADLLYTADPQVLSLVISNLLSNAAQYTNDGGRIWTAANGTDSLQLSVSNTGCTLSAEQVSRVFDRFWRGDVSRSSENTHSGLGLALVQRAVHVLGGDVQAVVAGDVFAVTLTLKR